MRPHTYHRGGPLLFLVVVHRLLELRKVETSRANLDALSAACLGWGGESGRDDVRGLRISRDGKP